MRLTVTVVSPATGRQADVAIETDPGTTLAQVAAEFDRLMHGVPMAVPEPWVPALFAGGHRVPGGVHRLVPGMTDIGGLVAGEALVAGRPSIEIADPAVPPLAVRVIIGPGDRRGHAARAGNQLRVAAPARPA